MKSSRLVDNINSAYISSTGKLTNSNRIMVYVEGYEDVAFWRTVLSEFETNKRQFEISTPTRPDLAKGKKVVLTFAEAAGANLLLCIDSDFDYIFGNQTSTSRMVNGNKWIIQTYCYAIENLLCYAPSLHQVSVRATKNDSRMFDYVEFFERYSQIIYPIFLWYAYAAMINQPSIYTLSEFRNTIRINFLAVEDNGESTLVWLERQVAKKLKFFNSRFKNRLPEIKVFEQQIAAQGVNSKETYLYIQGHALLDNVVKVVVATVCDALRKATINQIQQSTRTGISLRNELSYYNNSLRDIESIIADNTGYRSSAQFQKTLSKLREALGEL